MKIPLSWLKDFVNITVPVDEVVRLLTQAGLEVASVDTRAIPAGIVVGRVLDKAKHPNADKLSVCTVDAGLAAPLQIVCGAPNVAAGGTYPLAMLGTTFSDGMVIKQAKLRGVESFGMLCSQRELGLSQEHAGLYELPVDYVPGKPLNEYFPDDSILEIEITPNRGDCLSIRGVARELAAALHTSLKPTGVLLFEKPGTNIHSLINVTVQDKAGCPRYCGRLIRGITIAPSPDWLQKRLMACGLRPINNVVDVTNYMLLQFGQPMHAFDYNAIADKKIIVCAAHSIPSIKTLDTIEHTLAVDDLLICDGSRPVALAGIMGGAGSEICDTTTDVFLECAFFDPITVRKTAKRLGISTDSSYRFERGVDPAAGLKTALDAAAALIAELGNGAIMHGLIDTGTALEPKQVSLRPTRVARILGITLSAEQIIAMLTELGITLDESTDESLLFAVPHFRHDITGEHDLVEEVARRYGYDNIPSSSRAIVPLNRSEDLREERLDRIRTTLAGMGLNECATNSMTSLKHVSLCTPNTTPVAILNPLSPDMAVMRTSLCASLGEVAAYNRNRKSDNNRLFEIGRIFEVQPGAGLPRERDCVGIFLEGNWQTAAWNSAARPTDFFILKGVVDAVARALGMTFSYTAPGVASACYEGEIAQFSCSGITGVFGRLNRQLAKALDLDGPLFYAELDITDFLTQPRTYPAYHALPRFPAMERDFCFVVGEEVVAEAMAEVIRLSSPLVTTINVFDVYRGDKLPPKSKSIAFAVTLCSAERTLTDGEADAASKSIIKGMGEKFGAVLRT